MWENTDVKFLQRWQTLLRCRGFSYNPRFGGEGTGGPLLPHARSSCKWQWPSRWRPWGASWWEAPQPDWSWQAGSKACWGSRSTEGAQREKRRACCDRRTSPSLQLMLKTLDSRQKNNPKLHIKLCKRSTNQFIQLKHRLPCTGPLFNPFCAGGGARRNMSHHVKALQANCSSPRLVHEPEGAGVSGRTSLTSTKLTNHRRLLDESPWNHYFHWLSRNTGQVYTLKFSKSSQWISFHTNATFGNRTKDFIWGKTVFTVHLNVLVKRFKMNRRKTVKPWNHHAFHP